MIFRQGETGHVLVNRASYGAYVHAKAHQAAFHGARGWKTDEEAIRAVENSGQVQEMARQFVEGWLTR